MRIGVIGCVERRFESLQQAGIEVIAYALNEDDGRTFAAAGIRQVDTYLGFWDLLDYPRSFLLDLPIGAGVDRVIDEAYQHMEPGDVLIDPTGSYWCDTLRRYRRMRHRSLYYLDVASIERDGRPSLLLAGDDKGVEIAMPLLEQWQTGGHAVHVGAASLAHYMLMVDEAARSAMAQARNEAALMIEAWPGDVNEAAAKNFFPLVERTATGRAAWQVDDALRLEAATPVLAQAAMLDLAEALEEQVPSPQRERVGPFQHPDEIL